MKGAEPVSVIVATYHREALLVDTIADLLRMDYPDYEIIVVDQSARHEPETLRALAGWADAGVIRWRKMAEPSLTRARNVGWREAHGRAVIYVDDDVRIPDAQFIRHHLDALGQEGIGAVAGRVLEPAKPPKEVSRAIGWLGWSGAREPGFGSRRSGPAWSVRGCNMAFWRDALEAVGGFDEGYTRSAFREDTDIALRLRRRGYRLWFSADAWLYHLGASEGGTRDASIPVAEDLIRNDARFIFKNLSGTMKALWLARLYASRVIKASLRGGQFSVRHNAFWRAVQEAGAAPH